MRLEHTVAFSRRIPIHVHVRFLSLSLVLLHSDKNSYEYIIACCSHDFLLQLMPCLMVFFFILVLLFRQMSSHLHCQLWRFRGLPLALLKLEHHVIVRYDCLI